MAGGEADAKENAQVFAGFHDDAADCSLRPQGSIKEEHEADEGKGDALHDAERAGREVEGFFQIEVGKGDGGETAEACEEKDQAACGVIHKNSLKNMIITENAMWGETSLQVEDFLYYDMLIFLALMEVFL